MVSNNVGDLRINLSGGRDGDKLPTIDGESESNKKAAAKSLGMFLHKELFL